MRYHLMPEQRASLTSNRTAQRQPEVADENDNSVSRIERNFGFLKNLSILQGAKAYLFAIGGGSLFAIHSECEVYNPRTDRWQSIEPMEVNNQHVNNFIG